MRRLLPGAVVALSLAVWTVPGGPPAASVARASAAPAAECADALLVAVPGGGQGAGDDPGATLSGLTTSLVGRAAASGRTVGVDVIAAATRGPAALKGRGTGRTAAQRAVTRAAWREWRAPVSQLVEGVDATVTDAVAACPEQLLYLTGYSQGAEAVHQYLAGTDADLRSRIVAVVLVADPARVAGTGGRLWGDPRARRSGEGVSARLARRPLAKVPADGWAAPIHSVCSAGDLACDLGPTRFRQAKRIHASYDDAPMADRLDQLGRRYGARLTLWPKPAVGQRVTGTQGLLLSARLTVDVAPNAVDDLRFDPTSALPPGVTLTRRGVLRGTPTAAGTWQVGYTVRNTASAAVSRPVPGAVSLTVEEATSADVAAGGRHTCEIRADGTLWCWGANFYGQLGTGDTASGPVPRRVGDTADWTTVSTGGMHTCGVRENGTLWCWGLNYRGQLGIGNRQDKTSPRRVAGRDWVSVDAGWVHTCGIRTDGSAWCWGDNDHGQLGHGDRADSKQPVRVTRGMAWQQVAAGGWHSCGVTTGGMAYCWGRNIKGQVGDGTYVMRINPARVGQASDWASLDPAWTHTCGVRSGGSISCWGGNEGRQLGGGPFGGSPTPRPLDGDQTWTAVSTGLNFSCGLDGQQELWCWGTGRQGQLGDSQRSSQPIRMFDGTQWSTVDMGWLFGCGLDGGGAACWGNDETGELGRRRPRTVASAPEPTQGGFQFNLVSFNVLGSNHTSPRRDAGEFSPARVRAEWMIDYLRSVEASVVGFQEIQKDQVGWFTRGAGSTYEVWPGTSRKGNKGMQTSIAWKRSVWEKVASDTVTIPFITQQREMPLVRLKHKQTGRHIWVMNIHNAPQDHQHQRNVAVKREIERLKKVVGRGDPVFLVGDFNERERAFCQVTGKLGFVAPRGGSFSGGRCRPPSGYLRVDWIFGSRDVSYSGYKEDKSALVKLMTDHAVLRTRVSVP